MKFNLFIANMQMSGIEFNNWLPVSCSVQWFPKYGHYWFLVVTSRISYTKLWLKLSECSKMHLSPGSLRWFPAICGCLQRFSAIFSNFQQLQMLCGKFCNPTKTFKVNISFQYKVMAVFVDFQPFLKISSGFGNFWHLVMSCGKFCNTKNLKSISQCSTKVLAVFGNFWPFSAISGHLRQLVVFIYR